MQCPPPRHNLPINRIAAGPGLFSLDPWKDFPFEIFVIYHAQPSKAEKESFPEILLGSKNFEFTK